MTIKTKPAPALALSPRASSQKASDALTIVKKPPVHGGGHVNVAAEFGGLSDDVFLTEREAARVCGFSPWTLRTWRLKAPGRGPQATLFPSSDNRAAVRYRTADVRAWLKAFSSAAA